jgi:hypothetical protein
MSSQKRIDASRKNGALGGPKTPKGKEVSSRNACKHPFTVLSTENQADLDQLHQALCDEWLPTTFTKTLILEELSLTLFHIKRTAYVEDWLLERAMGLQEDENKVSFPDGMAHETRTMLAYRGCIQDSAALDHVQRERARLHRLRNRSIKLLMDLRQGRNPGASNPPEKNQQNEPRNPVESAPIPTARAIHIVPTLAVCDWRTQYSRETVKAAPLEAMSAGHHREI